MNPKSSFAVLLCLVTVSGPLLADCRFPNQRQQQDCLNREQQVRQQQLQQQAVQRAQEQARQQQLQRQQANQRQQEAQRQQRQALQRQQEDQARHAQEQQRQQLEAHQRAEQERQRQVEVARKQQAQARQAELQRQQQLQREQEAARQAEAQRQHQLQQQQTLQRQQEQQRLKPAPAPTHQVVQPAPAPTTTSTGSVGLASSRVQTSNNGLNSNKQQSTVQSQIVKTPVGSSTSAPQTPSQIPAGSASSSGAVIGFAANRALSVTSTSATNTASTRPSSKIGPPSAKELETYSIEKLASMPKEQLANLSADRRKHLDVYLSAKAGAEPHPIMWTPRPNA